MERYINQFSSLTKEELKTKEKEIKKKIANMEVTDIDELIAQLNAIRFYLQNR